MCDQGRPGFGSFLALSRTLHRHLPVIDHICLYLWSTALCFIFFFTDAGVCFYFTNTYSSLAPPQFKDQVVREAVEKICREFSGQCCIHKPLGGGGSAGAGGGRGEAVGAAEAQQVPEVSSTLPGAPSSSTPPCSSCRGQTTGGGYQCRCVA